MDEWDGGACVMCKKPIEKPEDAIVINVLYGNPYQHHACFTKGVSESARFASSVPFYGSEARENIKNTAKTASLATDRGKAQNLYNSNVAVYSIALAFALDGIAAYVFANASRINFTPLFSIAIGILGLLGLAMSLSSIMFVWRLREMDGFLKINPQ